MNQFLRQSYMAIGEQHITPIRKKKWTGLWDSDMAIGGYTIKVPHSSVKDFGRYYLLWKL